MHTIMMYLLGIWIGFGIGGYMERKEQLLKPNPCLSQPRSNVTNEGF